MGIFYNKYFKQTIAWVLISAQFFTPVLAQIVPTTITPTTKSTKVYLAPNKVTVVDIATPNTRGISHNYYNKFNIGRNGVVLNNTAIANLSVRSRLAGQILANRNLTKSAGLIINEIMSANTSKLNGFLEVAGKQADVIIANPWGITCDNCGFINSPRVSLITGSSYSSPNGGVNWLIDKGSILFKNGLNGVRQNILDLVARKIEIDGGQINAKDLALFAGKNKFLYDSRLVEKISGGNDNTRPAYAISSSLYGGMYADKIKIVSTEIGARCFNKW